MQHVLEHVKEAGAKVSCMRDQTVFAGAFADSPYTDGLRPDGIELGTGRLNFSLPLKDGLFNRILGEECGTTIEGDAHLLRLMKELVAAKSEYDHVADALRSVRETGYGLVTPTMSELTLQEPEIVQQGSRFGVRLKANAPSLHLIRVDIETEVSPVVGTEKQSEELVKVSIGGIPERPPDHLEHELLRQEPARAGAGGPCQQADAHARGRSGKSAGDPQQDHQRRQRRHDLHPPLAGQGVIPCTPHRAHRARGYSGDMQLGRGFTAARRTGLAARGSGADSRQLHSKDRHSATGLMAR